MTDNPRIQHAFDVLESAETSSLPACVAVVGDSRFLKQLVFRHFEGTEPDESLARLPGTSDWREVIDELSTASLFSDSPPRLILIDADDFVTRHRQDLESLVAQNRSRSTLFLDLRMLRSNTKLYEKISTHGRIIECRVPQIRRGKSKQPDTVRLRKWLAAWAHQHHQIRLTRDAIDVLHELIDWDFGRLGPRAGETSSLR